MSASRAVSTDATGGSAALTARWTLVACILASSLSFVEGSVLNVALPAIRSGFQGSAQDVQWVVNAYLLPLSALLLLGGALGDHFGRRRMLVIGTTLFAASSLVCALATSLALFVGARAAQGIGAALLLPNSLALLNRAYAGEARGRAVGIWAASGAAAAAVAPLIGGWLVANVGWPAIFYINLPIALGAVLIALRFVDESREEAHGRTDYLGAILATAGLGGLTYGLTAWSAAGDFGRAVIPSLVGLAMLVAFLWNEHRRGARAMMPLALFENRAFSGLNFLTFLLYGAFGAAMLLIPYVLIVGANYSAIEAGLAMMPLPILLTALSPTMGRLAAGLGPKLPLAIGPAVVAGGFLLAAVLGGEGGYWTNWFPCIVVMAIGMTIAVAPLTTSILASVEEQHVAMASGFNSAVARTGGLIATALLGAVLSSSGAQLIARFHGAMLVSAVVAAAASVVALTTLGPVRSNAEAPTR